MDPLLIEFHEKLNYQKVNKNNIYDEDIGNLYRNIIKMMALDYQVYQKNVGLFLATLEENHGEIIPFAVDFLIEQIYYITKEIPYSKLDTTLIEGKVDKDLIARFFKDVISQLEKHKDIRISDENLSFDRFSEKEIKALAGFFIEKMQVDSKNLDWSLDMVKESLNLCSQLRQLLKKINGVEFFYHSFGLILDRLSSSEFYQIGRDVSEDILNVSFRDKVSHLGFFNSFRFYSQNNSVHAGLMYANLCSFCVIRDTIHISDKFVEDLIWQSVKFFRNIEFFPLAKEFYNLLPNNLFKDDYHRRGFDHTYFLILLAEHSPQLPFEILDYLNKERESILKGGENELLPWYITLLNIRRVYTSADFTTTGLGFYLNVFENIIPKENYKKYKIIIDGGLEELKAVLQDTLSKLYSTRFVRDFIYDNETAIKISNRLIPLSVEGKDTEGFLLGMIIKSDHSVGIKDKASQIEQPILGIESPDYIKFYKNPELLTEVLELKSGIIIIWLAVCEQQIYEMSLLNEVYQFNQLEEWSVKHFKELVSNDFFSSMEFTETKNVNGQIKSFFEEDFFEEEKNYRENLNFSRIYLAENIVGVYYVSDMLLSGFPHQMLLNSDGEFISKSIPTTNVLSLDWLTGQKDESLLPNKLTKAIWIPTETKDFALIYLENFIDETLNENGFLRYNSVILEQPLSSDINIICSHGGSDIAEIQIVSHEDSITYELDHIIGTGKILILFVCHAGSKQNEMFRNNVNSLIKRFILNGYQAVIAPAWALDISIPKYWLPVFLECIENGFTIDKCVHEANKKVYYKYPTPAAWANLHLHGNPNLKKGN